MEEESFLQIPRPSWMAKAACRGLNPNLMMPLRGEDSRPAKAVCLGGCAVLAECREYGLADRMSKGVMGGLSERERRKIREAGGE